MEKQNLISHFRPANPFIKNSLIENKITPVEAKQL